MTQATATKTEAKAKQATVKKAEAKKEESKDYSFSQFVNEYNKKTDRLTLSVVKTEKGKASGEKLSALIPVKSYLSIFEKIKSIKDGKQRRKEAIKSVSVYVKALKTERPRAHVVRPLIECIKENYGKDYMLLLQKSFQR